MLSKTYQIVEYEPMRVELFGQYPGWSSKGVVREIAIASPSFDVIRPFCAAPTQLRFTDRTYAPPAQLGGDADASPRKRQRTSRADLDNRWSHARELMLRHYQRMNEGFPLTLSQWVRDDSPEATLLPSKLRPTSRQASISLLSELDDTDEFWEAPESPYEIPGELVLAREKRSYTQYWPAKLMRYIPPTARGDKAQYEVLFFDGKVKKLLDDSDMFYNEAHPNFKSCVVCGMH